MKLKKFIYRFDAGPFSGEEELLGDWDTGNCRRMLQWYFHETQGIFLHPEQTLCPTAYHETGDFVFMKGQRMDFSRLQTGDIIYAERVRSKNGDLIDKSEGAFADPDDYIISLHTALYVREREKEILHATSIEGGSCQWPLEKFLHFYRPVAVKRIVRNIPSTSDVVQKSD